MHALSAEGLGYDAHHVCTDSASCFVTCAYLQWKRRKMCVWTMSILQCTFHFHLLNKLLQVLYWTKVILLINLGYSQSVLHCEQFYSSWYPIQHQSWLPWLVPGCLIRFPSCFPFCCPETLHNVLLCALFTCSHGHCSLNQQCKFHSSEVPRVPANSQQHSMCSEF